MLENFDSSDCRKTLSFFISKNGLIGAPEREIHARFSYELSTHVFSQNLAFCIIFPKNWQISPCVSKCIVVRSLIHLGLQKSEKKQISVCCVIGVLFMR